MGMPAPMLTTFPTMAVEISTPGTASRKIGSHSLRSVFRLRRKAASKINGGTKSARISSLVNLPRRADVSGSAMSLGKVMTPSVGKIANASPASTSATVYGMRTLRTRIATPLTSKRRRTKTISSWMRVDSVLPCATNDKNMAGGSSSCFA